MVISGRILFILMLIAGVTGCKSWGKFWLTELSYATSPLLLTQNVAMTPITPALPGSPRSCKANPNLPDGLSLADDCTISGTPTKGQGTLPYRITADLGSDIISGDLRIRVFFQPRFLYSANSGNGTVSAFNIDATTGALALIGSYGAGTGPRTVVIHPSGKFAYLTNTNSGNISAYNIDQPSGALTNLAASPYSTSVNPYGASIDPQGRFLYIGHENAAVAGVSGYTIDQASGALTLIAGSPFAVAAGSTPVSVMVSPDGNHLYVGSSQSTTTAHAFTINQATGSLTQIAGSPFTLINDAISVYVHPSGRFVYYAQYFAPTGVVGLSRDSASGSLSLLAGSPFAAGLAPGFVMGDVNGRFVFVANSGDAGGTAAISAFTVNTTTGQLSAISGSPFAAGANPISVAFDETSRFVYTANTGSNTASAYTLNSTTGVITQISGSPYAIGAGTGPFGIAVAGSNQ